MKRALFSMIMIAGLGLSLSGCGAAFETPESYDGTWQGSWNLSDDTAAGALTMVLSHSGQHVSGTVEIDGTFCIGSAGIEATIENGALSGSFSNGVGSVDIDGDIDGSGEFNGTFTVDSGLCKGARGSFVMHH